MEKREKGSGNGGGYGGAENMKMSGMYIKKIVLVMYSKTNSMYNKVENI